MLKLPVALFTFVISGFLSLVPASLQAHHSRAGFNLEESTKMQGTITKFRWGNPHIFINVMTEDGNVWLIEGHSIPGVAPLGWKQDMFKEGDHVQLAANLATDTNRKFGLLDWIVTADGIALRGFQGSEIPEEFADNIATGEAAEQEEAVEPSTDFSGHWEIVQRGGFRRRTTIPGAAMGLPLTATGKAQITSYDADRNPLFECIQPGFPQLFLGTRSYGLRFVRYDDRIEMTKEHNNVSWTVWLDEDATPENPPRAPVGLSIGQLEDDYTLVFETTNFSVVPWGTGRGVDSSEEKHVSTRMQLMPDGMSIEYTSTITDPVYLTEPRTQTGAFRKRPALDFGNEPPCDPEVSSVHLTIH